MADKIYIGNSQVTAIYVGDIQVYGEAKPLFRVDMTRTHCTTTDITTIEEGATAQVNITPEDGYFIRESDIIVEGADYSFDNINYILTISNPVSNVAITINCLELYLHFSNNQNFTMRKSANVQFDGTLEYSTDKINWIPLHSATEETTEESQNFYLRGINNTYVKNNYNNSTPPFHFTHANTWLSGAVDALLDYQITKVNGCIGINSPASLEGIFANMMSIGSAASLIFSDNISNTNVIYSYMFSQSGLMTPPKLPSKTTIPYCYSYMFSSCEYFTNKVPQLPATMLTEGCYNGMFYRCTRLKKVPELPATTLARCCYAYMFSNCTQLTIAPVLPATILAEECYAYMFAHCVALLEAPELPATTLMARCYYNMFTECRAITTPPVLPATNLANDCYHSMFQNTRFSVAPQLPATTLAAGCYNCMFFDSGLITPPVLPATALEQQCYSYMFASSQFLTSAPELPATILAFECYAYMFSGCSSLTLPPQLPATTLAISCYNSMFVRSGLTESPNLPATTLTTSCYCAMFQGCTMLTKASELPATVLAEQCYTSMYSSCTALSTPPALPATHLAAYCYESMFYKCTALETLPELPATELVSWCYHGMFSGCGLIKLSETSDAEYTIAYRIPFTGTGTTASQALMNMFTSTGGTFTGTPVINTTYYTSNQVI